MLSRFAHLAGIVPATNPRAAGVSATTVPGRTDRAAKSTSTKGATDRGGSGTRKVDRSGNPSATVVVDSPKRRRKTLDEKHDEQQRKKAEPEAYTGRFRHLAGMGRSSDPIEPASTDIPAAHGMRQAAIRRALAGHALPAAKPLPSSAAKLGDQAIAVARRAGVIK